MLGLISEGIYNFCKNTLNVLNPLSDETHKKKYTVEQDYYSTLNNNKVSWRPSLGTQLKVSAGCFLGGAILGFAALQILGFMLDADSKERDLVAAQASVAVGSVLALGSLVLQNIEAD